jgi:hypothetical protein
VKPGVSHVAENERVAALLVVCLLTNTTLRFSADAGARTMAWMRTARKGRIKQRRVSNTLIMRRFQ